MTKRLQEITKKKFFDINNEEFLTTDDIMYLFKKAEENERLKQSRSDYKRKWENTKKKRDKLKEQLRIADKERRKIHGSLGGHK